MKQSYPEDDKCDWMTPSTYLEVQVALLKFDTWFKSKFEPYRYSNVMYLVTYMSVVN